MYLFFLTGRHMSHRMIQVGQAHTFIIINVTHISMFRKYSFTFGRNVTKHGRNMERPRECKIADPKFELKSFHPSSCVFYGRGYI